MSVREYPIAMYMDGRPVIAEGAIVEVAGQRYRAELVYRMRLEEDRERGMFLTGLSPFPFYVRLHPLTESKELA